MRCHYMFTHMPLSQDNGGRVPSNSFSAIQQLVPSKFGESALSIAEEALQKGTKHYGSYCKLQAHISQCV